MAENSLLKTINQGATWFALPELVTYDKRNIYFLNDSVGFFLAGYGDIYKTTDGGMIWSWITTNCSTTITEEDIFFLSRILGILEDGMVAALQKLQMEGIHGRFFLAICCILFIQFISLLWPPDIWQAISQVK